MYMHIYIYTYIYRERERCMRCPLTHKTRRRITHDGTLQENCRYPGQI